MRFEKAVPNRAPGCVMYGRKHSPAHGRRENVNSSDDDLFPAKSDDRGRGT
jgi:hypothetical protein